MSKAFIDLKSLYKHWIIAVIGIMLFINPISAIGQTINGEETTKELARLGFENVRWAENDEERIYSIENNIYKAQGVGIAKAIDVIQKLGLPRTKDVK